MRRTTALALALPLLAGLAACGGGSTTGTETTTPPASTTTVTSDPSTPSTSPPATTGPDTPTGSSTGGGIGENFQALGTEPFWNVAVTGTTLRYSQVDQPERELTATKTGDPDEPTFTGTNEGVQFRLEIEREACSDGMSDTDYPYSAEFRYGEVELKGCARPAG